ncbi:hypothetical protein IQ13_4164 [Lacibacter cauensis]|uniref:Uncharacterized protein n=1 Tax=Lacibacter cauensis TaxID=510947 RepID=A0A562S9Q8_9BACT|nr:hypothetical protein [Lacibacter cauensis]TWI77923.1 hypothetical protein IQ13_4164 [Lacibacter cauensis]
MKSKLFYAVSIMNVVMFSFYFLSFREKQDNDLVDKILKVRGLVVVDSLGIERVIIGSPLPTAQSSFGNRIYPREKGAAVSGVMLYDAEGQERGGYVTDDDYGNVFLTLDSKTSQSFLAIAEPNGSTALQLWDRKGINKISLETTDGQADIVLKRNNKTVKLYQDEK